MQLFLLILWCSSLRQANQNHRPGKKTKCTQVWGGETGPEKSLQTYLLRTRAHGLQHSLNSIQLGHVSLIQTFPRARFASTLASFLLQRNVAFLVGSPLSFVLRGLPVFPAVPRPVSCPSEKSVPFLNSQSLSGWPPWASCFPTSVRFFIRQVILILANGFEEWGAGIAVFHCRFAA